MSMIRYIAIAALLASAAIFSGCGYHLGTEVEVPFSSITIEPVKNESFAPQMQAEIHRQLADAFASEPSMHVVPSGGQAHIKVTLVEYRRDVAAVNPSDTASAASYRVTLSAKATLLDSTGKVLFRDRPFSATLPAYAANGFSRTEYQTLPLLSRELARNIKDSSVDVW